MDTNDLPPATRPQTVAGKLRRRQQILDASRELLGVTSPQSLTVEAIAARAGVSQPTVFNLVGRREQIWSALAEDALGALALKDLDSKDPRERATQIVGSVIDMACRDAPVFRALLVHWRHSALLVEHDPTEHLVACFEAAGDGDAHLSARVTAAGLIGILHQWALALISDDEARRRGAHLVHLVMPRPYTDREYPSSASVSPESTIEGNH